MGVLLTGIATDGTHVFAVDYNSDHVLEYTVGGAYVGAFNLATPGASPSGYPYGVGTDGHNVFAVEIRYDRVVEFAPALAAVPEPSSLALLTLGGLTALARWRIGRRRVEISAQE